MPRKSSDERIAEMTFGAIYPLYVSKVEKKGKTREQLDEEKDLFVRLALRPVLQAALKKFVESDDPRPYLP